MSGAIETFYGKYYKFEVFRGKVGFFGDVDFWVYRDGKLYKGSYSSLADAVSAARKMAEG